MVEAARQNSLKYGLEIDFINSGMTDMVCNLKTHEFDLIMCMGNTLPHLLSAKELDIMLNSCKQLLNPDGHLILNLLNYDRLLDHQERIVGITRNKDHEFIRFYDFEKPFVDFNILEVNWSDQPVSHNLSTTRLYPYRLQELKSALDKTGFDDITVYEGLKFQEYDLNSSKSVMITAKCS
jgi:SAM-dependent methyltransferase